MPASDDIIAGAVVVHPHEHRAVVRGCELDLTCREFEIVRRLVEHPGWVFSSEQLSSDETEADYSPESVSVLVSRLRRKLAGAGVPDAIETVRGFGYRLRVPASEGAGTDGAAADARTRVRDALWHLQEAALEVEHAGTDAQRRTAAEALEAARRIIGDALAG
jgi:DNA-binding winged helix-turn-helix (wHTH) protein